MKQTPRDLYATVLSGILAALCSPAVADTALPVEPVEIGQQTQFFVDDYIVDNRWPLLKLSTKVL